MKTPNLKKCLVGVLFAGLVILMGCRPTVQDVVKVIAPVPLGVSRDEVRKFLVDAYGEKFPKLKQSYALVNPPIPVTKLIIKADIELLAGYKKEGHFTYVYPSDLYDKMPAKAFTEDIGLISGASYGAGFAVFYDSNTNYIGFSAFSTEKTQ
jgi:hypothetical protein